MIPLYPPNFIHNQVFVVKSNNQIVGIFNTLSEASRNRAKYRGTVSMSYLN